MITGIAGQTAEALLTGAPTGRTTGQFTFRVVDPPSPPGAIVVAETSAGIAEGPAGVYTISFVLPAPGAYLAVWFDTITGLEATEEVVSARVAPWDVRAALERRVAADMEPVLTSADIDELLSAARRPDRDGILPSETGWTATYDFDSAAAAGWELKAARAAGSIDFGEDGQRFNESQVHAQCMAMAKLYRRGAASVFTGSVASSAV